MICAIDQKPMAHNGAIKSAPLNKSRLTDKGNGAIASITTDPNGATMAQRRKFSLVARLGAQALRGRRKKFLARVYAYRALELSVRRAAELAYRCRNIRGRPWV